MKIAVVVQGRFHAFDLSRALLERGDDVYLFTNYPKSVVARFGFPAGRVRSCVWHGVASRVLDRLWSLTGLRMGERWLHESFGRWAARSLSAEAWQVVHVWSGVAEEVLVSLKGTSTRTWLMRGSAHIRVQARLLEEEAQRTGSDIEIPSEWMIAREEREYAMADQVRVLSSFARDTFLEQGVPAGKLVMIPLAAGSVFRATPEQVAERCRRIRSGAPLRVLFVGTLSARKGSLDLLSIARVLDRSRFLMRIVGSTAVKDSIPFSALGSHVVVEPRQRQDLLPAIYAWGDVFVFPTIEDGFAVVLAQALANALPVLATANCGAPDLVEPEVTGWILPIRSPASFVERLDWAERNRTQLAEMIERLHGGFRARTWSDVAHDFGAVP